MNKRPEFENNEAWHSRGFLPHYDVAHKYQMITYRLADSLPQEVLAGSAGVPPANDETQRRKLIEKCLDKGYGSCVFKEPACAQIVVDAWKYFDGARYDLIAYVVMPNHVHVLIKTYEGYALSEVVHSWKSFTAHEIKKFLKDNAGETPANSAKVDMVESVDDAGETPALPACGINAGGTPAVPVWQEEYWDRFIRDEQHFYSAINYILENPEKAGLVKNMNDWQWSFVNSEAGGTAALPAKEEKIREGL